MLKIVDSEGCSAALSRSLRAAQTSLYKAFNLPSRTSARSISFFSSSVVSRYKYLIKSVWVNVFIIGSVFHHFLAQIDECVSHPAQSRINTDACAVGDFLKTHIKVVPHYQHMFLLFRKLADIVPQLRPGFTEHLLLLARFLREIHRVEQLAAIFQDNFRVSLLLPEMIDSQVVGYATDPG